MRQARRVKNYSDATLAVEADPVRFVNGRVFKRQGILDGPSGERLELWVDTAYTADTKITEIRFGSDAYFALLDQPGMSAWLAISPELVLVTGEGEAVRVTTAE